MTKRAKEMLTILTFHGENLRDSQMTQLIHQLKKT